jgi:hypothetical protein
MIQHISVEKNPKRWYFMGPQNNTSRGLERFPVPFYNVSVLLMMAPLL